VAQKCGAGAYLWPFSCLSSFLPRGSHIDCGQHSWSHPTVSCIEWSSQHGWESANLRLLATDNTARIASHKWRGRW